MERIAMSQEGRNGLEWLKRAKDKLISQREALLIDLPEVVNEAIAELVRSARSVFIVCTPEMASLKMARFR